MSGKQTIPLQISYKCILYNCYKKTENAYEVEVQNFQKIFAFLLQDRKCRKKLNIMLSQRNLTCSIQKKILNAIFLLYIFLNPASRSLIKIILSLYIKRSEKC